MGEEKTPDIKYYVSHVAGTQKLVDKWAAMMAQRGLKGSQKSSQSGDKTGCLASAYLGATSEPQSQPWVDRLGVLSLFGGPDYPSKPGSAIIPFQTSILLLPELMVFPDVVLASGVSSTVISLCQD